MTPNPERYVWAEHRSLFAKEPEMFLAGPFPSRKAAIEAIKGIATSLGWNIWEWHVATLKSLPEPLFIWTTWDHANHNAPPFPVHLVDGKPVGLRGTLLGMYVKLANDARAARAEPAAPPTTL